MDDVDLGIHRGAQHLDAGHVKNRHFERRTIATRRSGGSLIAADIALLAATALVRSRSALRKNRRRRNRLHQQNRDSSKHNAMDLSHAPPPNESPSLWAQPPALTSRQCRHHFG